MKTLLASLALGLALIGSAAAQTPVTTPKGAKSDATFYKMRQIDTMLQLMPLNLKKEQIKKLLVQLDIARETEKQARMKEDDMLEKMDERVSKALSEAYEKGTYPPRDLQLEMLKNTQAMAISRGLVGDDILEAFYKGTMSIWEGGQMKVMMNGLDIAKLAPNLKVSEMKTEDKIKFFMRRVFLDPVAYDCLQKLQKYAP